MSSRWKSACICLLLGALVAGYYGYDAYYGAAEQLPSAGARSSGQPDQSWLNGVLGADAAPSYHVVFSCGHDGYFSPEELITAGLDFMVYDFERSVSTVQSSGREQTVLTGEVPVLCADCRTCYLIAEQDGCVAVYRGRSKESAVFLRRYADMPISALPEDVQQRLREGIVVHSDEELARVLEGLDG